MHEDARRLTGGAVIAALLSCAPVCAGSRWARPDLTLTVGLTAIDNVGVLRQDILQGGGSPASPDTLRTLGLKTRTSVGRLQLSSLAQHTSSARGREEGDYFRHQLDAKVELPTDSRLRLIASAEIDRYRQDERRRPGSADPVLSAIRAPDRSTYELTYDAWLDRSTRLELSGTYQTLDYENDRRRNNDARVARARMTRRIGGSVSAFVTGSNGSREYPNFPIDLITGTHLETGFTSAGVGALVLPAVRLGLLVAYEPLRTKANTPFFSQREELGRAALAWEASRRQGLLPRLTVFHTRARRRYDGRRVGTTGPLQTDTQGLTGVNAVIHRAGHSWWEVSATWDRNRSSIPLFDYDNAVLSIEYSHQL